MHCSWFCFSSRDAWQQRWSENCITGESQKWRFLFLTAAAVMDREAYWNSSVYLFGRRAAYTRGSHSFLSVKPQYHCVYKRDFHRQGFNLWHLRIVSLLCSLMEGSPLAPHLRELQRLLFPLVKPPSMSANKFLLYISFEFLATASGPVVTMKGSLHQGSHNTPHCCLIPTSVPLPIMLHSQPETKNWYQSFSSFYFSIGRTAVKKTVSHANVVIQDEIVLCMLQISPAFQTELWCQNIRTLNTLETN